MGFILLAALITFCFLDLSLKIYHLHEHLEEIYYYINDGEDEYQDFSEGGPNDLH